VVAAVTDPRPSVTPASLVATINWGDATPSGLGLIAPAPPGGPPQTFSVAGSHVYANGVTSAVITVIITDLVTGAVASTTSRVDLTPQLMAFPQLLTAPQVFDGVVAAFTDNVTVTPFPPPTPATFTATIDWGDATPNSAGLIAVAPPGVRRRRFLSADRTCTPTTPPARTSQSSSPTR
jgi:hypothetical protein